MIVKDIMTQNPEQISATATVAEAAEILFDKDIRHLPIIREGEVIGMLSERDLRGYAWSFRNEVEDPTQAETLPQQKVSELMSGAVLTVGPDDNIHAVIDIMLENKVGAVAVVDPHENTLVGIVSYVDILRATKELLSS